MNRWFKTVITLALLQLAVANLSPIERLDLLRAEMQKLSIDAYVIPAEDEHQSSYVAPYDQRRAWLSGFTGSSGVAVVTANKAGVWTDSRYYIQAEKELKGTEWILMKASDKDTLSIEAFLKQELVSDKAVGQTAKFFSTSAWQSREKQLKENNIRLEDTPDLVDIIWPANERPEKPNSPVFIHDIKFAGQKWSEKVALVQNRIKNLSVDYFIATALDEIAWTFNLRGGDILYNPMFNSYAVIFGTEKKQILFTNPDRFNDQKLRDHLKDGDNEVEIRPYQEIFEFLKQDTARNNRKIWVHTASYAIYNSIQNKDNVIISRSPIKSIKARKTNIELENIRRCQIRDSAARIRHMYWLEDMMSRGQYVSEITSSKKLEAIQGEDPLFVSLSFGPISAVGANAAIVHYKTYGGENKTLTKDQIYLNDHGGQYMDCTTDITRTHHYGKPKPMEIQAYTKVLQGSIDLAKLVFPQGLYGGQIDAITRRSLWKSGLDYGHGTGHGIGFFLGVHESPASISMGSSSSTDEPLDVGMVESDEPGYYQEGQFGIRLETDVTVVEKKTEYGGSKKFLGFDSLTLVPFEPNLIDECELTNEQVDWLNQYNKEIQSKVSGYMKTSEEKAYLSRKTQPFKYAYEHARCSGINNSRVLGASSLSVLVPVFTVLSMIHRIF